MAEKLSLREARARIAMLESIIRNTLWMARRYAHGRQSYAVGMYNDAAKSALKLALNCHMPDGSIFALDGTADGAGSPDMSGLSPEDFAQAAAGLNASGITPHPGRFSLAARAGAPANAGEGETDA